MVKLFERENLTGQAQFEPSKLGQQQSGAGRLSERKAGEGNGEQNASVLINYELVKQVRELLKKEYESVEVNKDGEYSRSHYEHIMDARHAQTCWRYLLENNMNVIDSFEQMKRNLAWRQANGVDSLGPQDFVKDFYLKAPVGFTGHTREGNDLIWITGKNYKKPEGREAKPIIKSFLLSLLYAWDREHQHDLDKFVLVVDVSSTTLRNLDLEFSAWLVTLRDYVPARTKAIYIVGIPYLMRPIIRLIITWLPEKYRQICQCCPLESLFEGEQPVLSLDQVPRESGGEAADTWRLAPREAPWADETDNYTLDELQQVNSAICFNTSAERLEQLYEMQRKFDLQQQT